MKSPVRTCTGIPFSPEIILDERFEFRLGFGFGFEFGFGFGLES
jgi:hypothetical protein